MKRGALLLLLFTAIAVLILEFSDVSVFFNLIQFVWILLHITLVIFLSAIIMKKGKVKGILSLVALFFLTGIGGLYLFPTEEITRLVFIEPAILVYTLICSSILYKVAYRINDISSLEQKRHSLIDNNIIYYILIILMSLFIIYSIFLPLVSGFIVNETIYKESISKEEYNQYWRRYIPISETTLSNPLPIYLSVPVNSADYCLFNNEVNPAYFSSAFADKGYQTVEEPWIKIDDGEVDDSWRTLRMLRDNSNSVRGDAAFTGYNHYQFYDGRPIVYRLPPFSDVTIVQAMEFDAFERSELSTPVGYVLEEINLIKVVNRGKDKLPGGHYPCSSSTEMVSIQLI